MGAVNPSAVASSRGMRLRQMKKAHMAIMLSTPRTPKSPSLRVRKGLSPRVKNQGTTAIRPNSMRKNAISSGCTVCETWRTAPNMHEIARVDSSIKAMPRRLPAARSLRLWPAPMDRSTSYLTPNAV